ncbi:hypothetical protein PENTCL1PPCAC_15782, partial [Pristionchus entomophagus]
RACTVFYRRSKSRKIYACRSNTRRCEIGAECALACKRCRFDRFERILKEAEMSEEREPSPVVISPTDPTPVTTSPSSGSPSIERLLPTPSASSAHSPESPSLRTER